MTERAWGSEKVDGGGLFAGQITTNLANPGPMHRYQEQQQCSLLLSPIPCSAESASKYRPHLHSTHSPQRRPLYFSHHHSPYHAAQIAVGHSISSTLPSQTRPHLRKHPGKRPARLGTYALTENKLCPHTSRSRRPIIAHSIQKLDPRFPPLSALPRATLARYRSPPRLCLCCHRHPVPRKPCMSTLICGRLP